MKMSKGESKFGAPAGVYQAIFLGCQLMPTVDKDGRPIPPRYGKDGKAMTPNAVQQMFRRRGRTILAMPNLHPHMLRHTFADTWLGKNEGQEGDLMETTVE